MTSLCKYGVLLTPKYGQKCKFSRVTQNLRVFAYIVRDYKSTAEATSLLSSVASLAISYIITTLIIAYENSRQFLLALRPWGRFARRNRLFSQVTLGLLIY